MKYVLVALILLSPLFIMIGSYISAYNFGNMAEQGIKATWENNQNILAGYTLKVQEAAQIPEMKTEDLQKVIEFAMGGRYGQDGSRAVFQWIQEAYPGQVTDGVYIQIQRIIEAGRNEFTVAQTRLVDQKRVYQTKLGSFWSGFWLNVAGYPKLDLNTYNVIITTEVERTFNSGKQSIIELRKKP